MARAALILAAGEGTRMKSALPKVAHPVLGVPMVLLVLETARAAGCDPVVVVTGRGAEVVETLLEGVACVRQDRQLGTGHAVMCAEEALASFEGSLLVLSGDSPLLRPETLSALSGAREARGAAASVLVTTMTDPSGYGRVLRDEDGRLRRIVEQKDLERGEEAADEVNTGTYCFDARTLFTHLHRLRDDNAQGEFYLTDMVEVLLGEGLGVEAMSTSDAEEAMGVNSRVQLAEATKVLQRRLNREHMLAGVTMPDPDLVWVGPHVKLGRDVTLEPMTFLFGDTEVEDGCVVGPDARLTDTIVRSGARIDSSVLIGTEVGEGATVGPMAYLRPGTKLAAGAKAGTFVEVKNSEVGEGSKVPHLSYVGDATIGRGVNVGAGTITCNYDGRRKHRTEIGDGAFIGSDTMLVAPVSIGSGAVTAAGSAISNDVPSDGLGIERAEQRNIEGWSRRRRERDEGEDD